VSLFYYSNNRLLLIAGAFNCQDRYELSYATIFRDVCRIVLLFKSKRVFCRYWCCGRVFKD